MVSFIKSVHGTAALAVAALAPSSLKIEDSTSVQGVAKTIAAGAMSYYPGTAAAFADLPAPYYWWECGALMGAMLDYSHYTNDTTYDSIITTALLAQAGPDFDLMVPAHYGDEGNDDQAFWSFAILSAAERNWPQPDSAIPSWLEIGENAWNSLASRWNTTNCGGGLLWQIFASNPNGLTYKNSVSNGGFFQISARLYRATNNQTYLDWANKIWDWSREVNFIDDRYNVYDGAGVGDDCKETNPVSFSYSAGIYLYGAAIMANVTNGTDSADWVERTKGLLDASKSFFSPFSNATNIMYEHACEQVDSCNTDMKSFKGYLSRFMWAATQMVPEIVPSVQALLNPSARAAADACSGGSKGTSCGQKWYVGGYDNVTGLGQEMSALETVHGILVPYATPPFKAGEIKNVRSSSPPTASVSPVPFPTSTPTPTKRSNEAGVLGVDLTWVGLSLLTGVFVWGLI
ncbi:putative glycoside hydrolase family 76 protein [Phaeoacremonium minimum UCRPA7]|uniref:Mannan endo-1,6-alpha-mannosidase n=1 Tax=Phaeoacremonium minimum (strain UCR-PA7) TaxID=1286976 RepID=R8BAP4_PHAM7|nr:putative glycoside hydrolase family 76 protein [Phaeoacremonium minimum UCRPA7]EON96352.1 putative glycoside hydrolase family 76 protein [Phaeoacremonium minimum UCRPA7]